MPAGREMHFSHSGREMHFSHLIQWQNLFSTLDQIPLKDNGVYLPIHSCGKPHHSKKLDRLLKTHSYLNNYICPQVDCETTREKKRFFKPNTQTRTDFVVKRSLSSKDKLRYKRFLDSFVGTVFTVARDFTKKVKPVVDKDVAFAEVEKIKSNGEYSEFYGDFDVVMFLIIEERLDVLFSLDQYGYFDLSEAISLTRPRGGQAVGNFWGFLLFGLLKVYMRTSICLHNGARDYACILDIAHEDCDARRFLPNFRPHLQPGTYLQDPRMTKELQRGLFRFIALYTAITLETGWDEYWMDRLKDKLNSIFDYIL